MINVAIYARVSTDDKGQTIKNQLLRLIPHCYQRYKSHEISYFRVYYDYESGKSFHRKGFEALEHDLNKYNFTEIIVTTPDRYSRNLVEALVSIEDRMNRNGIAVRFLDSGLIADKYPMPEDVWLFISIHFMLAEYYRRHLSTNTKAGQQRKLKEIGGQWSWAKITPEQKIEIMKLRAEGLSLKEIADRYHVSKVAIHKITTHKMPS